jgi:hypothetical protein
VSQSHPFLRYTSNHYKNEILGPTVIISVDRNEIFSPHGSTNASFLIVTPLTVASCVAIPDRGLVPSLTFAPLKKILFWIKDVPEFQSESEIARRTSKIIWLS